MPQLPTGCRLDTPRSRTSSASCSSVATPGPGSTSSTTSPFSACCAAILRAMRDAGDDRLHIVVAAQEVEADLGRRQRIGAFQPHRAAALGAQMHRTDRERRERMRDDAVARAIDRAPGGDVHLQVGPLQRSDRCAPARRHRVRCPTSARRARRRISSRRPADAGCCDAARSATASARCASAIGVEVVVQVGPDAGQIVQHRDAHVLQMLRRSDA